MGKKIVETLSIHSSRVALRARPLVKKSLLPPCFRDPLSISTRFDHERRSRTKDCAELEKSVSRVSRVAPSPTFPLRFPYRRRGSYFARNDGGYEQTRDEMAKSKRDRESKRGGLGGGSPRLFRVAAFGSGERPVSPIRFIFGSTFRPTGSQSAPPLSPGTIHLPRGTAYPFLRPPPPPPKFSKIRADRFFSFSRALLTWSDSPDSRVDSAIIGNNRDIDWLEIISVGRMAKIVLFLESVCSMGDDARRGIDSPVEEDVARTLTNRKGDVSCVVEREEDLCYEPDSPGADSRYRYMTRYKFYRTPPFATLLLFFPLLRQALRASGQSCRVSTRQF